jgi:hypothetical protein
MSNKKERDYLTTSITINKNMYKIIRKMADDMHRTFSGQANYLMEKGLADGEKIPNPKESLGYKEIKDAKRKTPS